MARRQRGNGPTALSRTAPSKDLTAEQISEVTAYKVTGLGRLSGAYRGGTECYSTHRIPATNSTETNDRFAPN